MSTAPTYVGGSSTGAQVSLNSYNQRTDVSGGLPQDFHIMVIQTSNQALSAPSGWTEFSSSPQGIGTAGAAGATRLCVFYRWADYDLNLASTTVSTGDSGDHQMGRTYSFRGVSRSNPINAITGGTTASTTAISISGVTTTVDNCLVIDLVGNAIDAAGDQVTGAMTNANLSGYTQQDSSGTTTGTGGGWNIATGTMATAGATGATTGTFGTSTNQAWLKIALAPAVAPYLIGLGVISGATSGITGLNWPSGHQADDIGIMFVESAGGEPVSTPSGWSTVTNSPQATGAGTAGTQLTLFYKRATSGAESSVNVADPGDHVIAVIHVFRNCTTSGSPFDAPTGGVKGAASTSVSVTGTTTTVNNTLVVYAVTRDNDSAAAEFSSWSNATPSAFVEAYDLGTATGNGGGFGIAIGTLTTAGATGTTTATTTNSVVNAQMVFGLKPPTAATTTARSFAVFVG